MTENNLPVFYQKLKDQLHFALAWDPAGGDFSHWRATARAKLWDLLIQPDDATPFDAQMVEEQDRGGYVAQKIVLSITGNSRIAALLLVPKGRGRSRRRWCCTITAASSTSARRKMIRPWGDDARLASAQAWVDKYYSGRFIGDDLARRGYRRAGDRRAGAGATARTTARSRSRRWPPTCSTSAPPWPAPSRLRMCGRRAGWRRCPEVDKGRVAAIGFSMGAFRAWQVAALTDDGHGRRRSQLDGDAGRADGARQQPAQGPVGLQHAASRHVPLVRLPRRGPRSRHRSRCCSMPARPTRCSR